MDIFDIIWNVVQDEKIAEVDSAHRKTRGTTTTHIQRLEAENHQLKIRIGVLLRMLIERGVFSAEDFHAAVTDTKARLEAAAQKKLPQEAKGKAAASNAGRANRSSR